MTLCILLSYKLMLAYFHLYEYSTQTLSKACQAFKNACMLNVVLFLAYALYQWHAYK